MGFDEPAPKNEQPTSKDADSKKADATDVRSSEAKKVLADKGAQEQTNPPTGKASKPSGTNVQGKGKKALPKAKIVNPRDEKKFSRYTKRPDEERYGGDDVDWSEIPPWRQASFFGIRAKGQLFVYIVDCSGSMLDDDRMAKAKIELRKSIAALRYPQRYLVIFYNDEPRMMPGGTPQIADQLNKDQLTSWLRIIDADGGTDPREAMAIGLSFQPDAVFLLSDGEYPDETADAIGTKNKRKVPIHCIDLSDGKEGDAAPPNRQRLGWKIRSPQVAAELSGPPLLCLSYSVILQSVVADFSRNLEESSGCEKGFSPLVGIHCGRAGD